MASNFLLHIETNKFGSKFVPLKTDSIEEITRILKMYEAGTIKKCRVLSLVENVNVY